MSELFAETNEATVQVLARNGFRVLVPSQQRCCGALHVHGGLPEQAKTLARRNIDAFPEDVDAIIVNAAGCGSALKEYGHLLAGDPVYAERAAAFAARVRDVTELLAGLSSSVPMRPLATRVTYHDACHLAHGQQIHEQPRALLRQIPGLELVELAEADVCCGSAGSYNLVEPAMSRRLLERKVTNIVNSGAECVVAANPDAPCRSEPACAAAACRFASHIRSSCCAKRTRASSPLKNTGCHESERLFVRSRRETGSKPAGFVEDFATKSWRKRSGLMACGVFLRAASPRPSGDRRMLIPRMVDPC
jgi:hypothetical protein